MMRYTISQIVIVLLFVVGFAALTTPLQWTKASFYGFDLMMEKGT